MAFARCPALQGQRRGLRGICQALTLAVATGNRYQQARAHACLAHARHAAGEDGLAREHWQHALTLYDDLGVPDAEIVRAHLAALSPNPETHK